MQTLNRFKQMLQGAQHRADTEAINRLVQMARDVDGRTAAATRDRLAGDTETFLRWMDLASYLSVKFYEEVEMLTGDVDLAYRLRDALYEAQVRAVRVEETRAEDSDDLSTAMNELVLAQRSLDTLIETAVLGL